VQAATGLTNHSGIYLASLRFLCDILSCDVYQLSLEDLSILHLQSFICLRRMLLEQRFELFWREEERKSIEAGRQCFRAFRLNKGQRSPLTLLTKDSKEGYSGRVSIRGGTSLNERINVDDS